MVSTISIMSISLMIKYYYTNILLEESWEHHTVMLRLWKSLQHTFLCAWFIMSAHGSLLQRFLEVSALAIFPYTVIFLLKKWISSIMFG